MVITTSAPPAGPSGPRPSGGPARRRPGEFGGGARKFTPRRKVCQFCVDKVKEVDYKDLTRLRRFLSERGKIEPRRKTGTCAAHQRSLNVALKRARQLALLPFTAEHIRVTGVLVREPGTPPFRGGRPRPAELEGAGAEAEAAAPAAIESPDGQAATATPQSAEPTAAEPAAPAPAAETPAPPAPAAEAPAAPAPAAEAPAAPAPVAQEA